MTYFACNHFRNNHFRSNHFAVSDLLPAILGSIDAQAGDAIANILGKYSAIFKYRKCRRLGVSIDTIFKG